MGEALLKLKYDLHLVQPLVSVVSIFGSLSDDNFFAFMQYWCSSPECTFDINSVCPPELAVQVIANSLSVSQACLSVTFLKERSVYFLLQMVIF